MMALWGGRFENGIDNAVFALSRSVHFDWRLAPYDLAASLVHLKQLEGAGLVDGESATKLRSALQELQGAVLVGDFLPEDSDEDVHSALERGLIARVGQIGGALRAGRSRNDQVATDLRLYLLDQMLEVGKEVAALASALLGKARECGAAIAPGLTHLQHAQPVTFAQELSKHAAAIERDLLRIRDWYDRSNFSPLGSGALAGTSLPLDPSESAKMLGFIAPVGNSIDGVSDRDFAAEALFILALIGVHLSRIGEEWTIWSTTEFGWAKLDDRFATGSSIMPQKKNPDVAELARGKAGPLIGNLMSLLATMKGLPFAYNRDLQEDKEVVFASVENLLLLLPALTGMVATTTFDLERMEASAPLGFSLATEIADYLVRKGIPFAAAHEAAGKCVLICEQRGLELHELDDAQLASVHSALDSGVRRYLDLKAAVAARGAENGTSPTQVARANKELEERIDKLNGWCFAEARRFSGMLGQ